MKCQVLIALNLIAFCLAQDTSSSVPDTGSSTVSSTAATNDKASSTTPTPTESTTTPSETTTTTATFDPNEACRERYQRIQYNITGEMREGHPCQYECFRTNPNRQRKTRLGIHNVDNFSSCPGDDKVCYRGECEDNGTPSGKACKTKYSGKVYGEPTTRRCKARCHRPNSDPDVINQADGTLCGQGREARYCQNGRCE